MSKSSWKRTNGGLPQGTKRGGTTVLEIIPRCSPSLLPIVVDQITNFSSKHGMELSAKKCKEIAISFFKYSVTTNNLLYCMWLVNL